MCFTCSHLETYFFHRCIWRQPTGDELWVVFSVVVTVCNHVCWMLYHSFTRCMASLGSVLFNAHRPPEKGAQTMAHLRSLRSSWFRVLDLSPGCGHWWLVFPDVIVMCLVSLSCLYLSHSYFLRDIKLNKLQINSTKHDLMLSCSCFSKL